MNDPAERFTALYDRHYRSVLGYALLRAGQDAAEDVVSETFLVAWRRLDDLPDPPLPWLLGVARNLLHKQYDSGRRRQALADRPGVALAVRADQHTMHGLERVEEHLVIDPKTAEVLARESYPVGEDGKVANAPSTSTLMISDGWTDRIGVPARG